MVQVCERPVRAPAARRLSAETFCALTRQGGGGFYRPRWEVLRMLAVGEAWGVSAPDRQAGLLVLPLEADVSLTGALRAWWGGLAPKGMVLTPPAGPAQPAGPQAEALAAALEGAVHAARRRCPDAPVWAVLELGGGLEQQLTAYFGAGFVLRALRPLHTLASHFVLCTGPAPGPAQTRVPLAAASQLALLLARGWIGVGGLQTDTGYQLLLAPPAQTA